MSRWQKLRNIFANLTTRLNSSQGYKIDGENGKNGDDTPIISVSWACVSGNEMISGKLLSEFRIL
jgi:hypothetical protein